jgi:coenzyme F420-reducing hydrogenase delta subunit
VGLAPERFEMFQVAASEGPKFAQVATEMAERALLLGPNPIKFEARQVWEATRQAPEATV